MCAWFQVTEGALLQHFVICRDFSISQTFVREAAAPPGQLLPWSRRCWSRRRAWQRCAVASAARLSRCGYFASDSRLWILVRVCNCTCTGLRCVAGFHFHRNSCCVALCRAHCASEPAKQGVPRHSRSCTWRSVSFVIHRTCDCLLGLQCNTEVCGRSRRCRPHCDTILRSCRCCSFCNVFVAAESVRDAAGCCGSARLPRQQLVVIMRAF